MVYLGIVLTTLLIQRSSPDRRARRGLHRCAIAAWLWFTVLFANFAEALAEGRGKAQAASLRDAAGRAGRARRRHAAATQRAAPSAPNDAAQGRRRARRGRRRVPGDGEVIDGVASVDESAITGESAPVVREAGGDRSSVTGGTRVLSDWLVVRIAANPGEAFLDRMIAHGRGREAPEHAERDRAGDPARGADARVPDRRATLLPFSIYAVDAAGQGVRSRSPCWSRCSCA